MFEEKFRLIGVVGDPHDRLRQTALARIDFANNAVLTCSEPLSGNMYFVVVRDVGTGKLMTNSLFVLQDEGTGNKQLCYPLCVFATNNEMPITEFVDNHFKPLRTTMEKLTPNISSPQRACLVCEAGLFDALVEDPDTEVLTQYLQKGPRGIVPTAIVNRPNGSEFILLRSQWWGKPVFAQ